MSGSKNEECIFFFLRLGQGMVEENIMKVYGECGLGKVVDGD